MTITMLLSIVTPTGNDNGKRYVGFRGHFYCIVVKNSEVHCGLSLSRVTYFFVQESVNVRRQQVEPPKHLSRLPASTSSNTPVIINVLWAPPLSDNY